MKNRSTKRHSIPAATIAIGVAALLGITACGSDGNKSSSDQAANTDQESDSDVRSGAEQPAGESGASLPDASLPDASLPGAGLPDAGLPGATLPSGGLPGGGGVSADCLAYYQLFAAAFAGDSSSLGDLDDAIAGLKSSVPDELEGDVELVASFYAELLEVSKKYEGNPSLAYSDPDLLAYFSDPEFTQAAERVNTWLTTECQSAG